MCKGTLGYISDANRLKVKFQYSGEKLLNKYEQVRQSLTCLEWGLYNCTGTNETKIEMLAHIISNQTYT